MGPDPPPTGSLFRLKLSQQQTRKKEDKVAPGHKLRGKLSSFPGKLGGEYGYQIYYTIHTGVKLQVKEKSQLPRTISKNIRGRN